MTDQGTQYLLRAEYKRGEPLILFNDSVSYLEEQGKKLWKQRRKPIRVALFEPMDYNSHMTLASDRRRKFIKFIENE